MNKPQLEIEVEGRGNPMRTYICDPPMRLVKYGENLMVKNGVNHVVYMPPHPNRGGPTVSSLIAEICLSDSWACPAPPTLDLTCLDYRSRVLVVHTQGWLSDLDRLANLQCPLGKHTLQEMRKLPPNHKDRMCSGLHWQRVNDPAAYQPAIVMAIPIAGLRVWSRDTEGIQRAQKSNLVVDIYE